MNTIICQACKKEILDPDDLFQFNLNETYFDNLTSKNLLLNYNFCRSCFADSTIVIGIIRYKTIHKDFTYVIFNDEKIKIIKMNDKLKQEILDLKIENSNDKIISIKEKELEENKIIFFKITNLDYNNFDDLYYLYQKIEKNSF